MAGFKTKFIKMLLRKKINGWLNSIKDEALREDCRKNAVVTGGCIVSLLLREDVSDYDIYLKDYSVVVRLANYYLEAFKEIRKKRGFEDGPSMSVEEITDVRGKPRVRIKVKSAGIASDTDKPDDYQYFEQHADQVGQDYLNDVFEDEQKRVEIEQQLSLKPNEVNHFSSAEDKEKAKQTAYTPEKYAPKYLSSNAVSLHGDMQIILRFYGEPADIHDTFDFVHATNYWQSCDGQLVLNAPALEAILTKSLVYQGSHYPVATMFRVRKFVAKGWTINAGQLLKIAMQVSKLDLHDFNILEDQLTGVDVAYFEQMISRLKTRDETKVDDAYLLELIDMLFGG